MHPAQQEGVAAIFLPRIHRAPAGLTHPPRVSRPLTGFAHAVSISLGLNKAKWALLSLCFALLARLLLVLVWGWLVSSRKPGPSYACAGDVGEADRLK